MYIEHKYKSIENQKKVSSDLPHSHRIASKLVAYKSHPSLVAYKSWGHYIIIAAASTKKGYHHCMYMPLPQRKQI
jgi:hypothetical protein